MEEEKVHHEVAEYYGKELKKTSDLKTNACCLTPCSTLPASLMEARGLVSDEVVQSFYGCGSPIPPELKNCVVLDLGSGSGVDSFTCSKLVGENGRVIGVDMTDEQLEKANNNITYHTEKFGYQKPNVSFTKGFIEDLSFLKDGEIDVVISNCVINLCSDKLKVFKEIHRVLKEGGELYFSDVYSSRRIPKNLQNDKELWGECLSGALYLEDFRRLMQKAGFEDTRVISSSEITIANDAIIKRVGPIRFFSNTVRAFKIKSLEDRCEDFGQKATYMGTMEDFPHAFFLDSSHVFVTGYPVAVCGNSAAMVSKTRYAKHFEIDLPGPHLGLFGESSKMGTSAGGCC